MVRLTTTLMESSRERRGRWEILLAWGLGAGLLLSASPALAIDTQVPWECSGSLLSKLAWVHHVAPCQSC
jgi:hypothetical protein